ncbi:hypothetical protein ABZP36_003322 [Zizania latifolia]
MEPTAPNGGGSATDGTVLANATVILRSLTLRNVPHLPAAITVIARNPYILEALNKYTFRTCRCTAQPATPATLIAYRSAGPRPRRELVVGLQELYGVRDVFGAAAGYRGFYGRCPAGSGYRGRLAQEGRHRAQDYAWWL